MKDKFPNRPDANLIAAHKNIFKQNANPLTCGL